MTAGRYILRKLLYGIPLLFGVTFISFVLMVYAGADQAYELAGKNPDPRVLEEVRSQLGLDRPFLARYAEYVRELATLDLSGCARLTNAACAHLTELPALGYQRTTLLDRDALEELLARFPGIHVTGEVSRIRTNFLNSIKHMTVALS